MKTNKKDLNILLQYIENFNNIYSTNNVFDYICEGDTAIITRQIYNTGEKSPNNSQIHSILILRKNLDFLNKHSYITKGNPLIKIKIMSELETKGYYIQEIKFYYSDLEDRNPDIITDENDNIICRFLGRKRVPRLKSFRYIPKEG